MQHLARTALYMSIASVFACIPSTDADADGALPKLGTVTVEGHQKNTLESPASGAEQGATISGHALDIYNAVRAKCCMTLSSGQLCGDLAVRHPHRFREGGTAVDHADGQRFHPAPVLLRHFQREGDVAQGLYIEIQPEFTVLLPDGEGKVPFAQMGMPPPLRIELGAAADFCMEIRRQFHGLPEMLFVVAEDGL